MLQSVELEQPLQTFEIQTGANGEHSALLLHYMHLPVVEQTLLPEHSEFLKQPTHVCPLQYP